MAYIQETCISGKVLEVTKYHDWLHGRRSGRSRVAKTNKTTEQMANINRKNAEKKLRRKINTGCRPGDYHLVLTYAGDAPEAKQAEKELKNYLKRLKRLYEKYGHELRWIAVTEYKSKRIHHHLVINQGPSLLEITGKWNLGRPKVTVLDATGQYSELAAYLIKQTDQTFRDPDAPQNKRYTCSRNWPKPKITKKVIKRERWVKQPKPWKGFYLEKEKTVEDINADGYPYQFYSMVQLGTRKKE
ncbi:MAG: hypothetical protein PHY23_06465 [Oscillospiraceae bacterium]|nr:hypothetical protein [Oscillospiraceae bacterium]